MAKIAMTVEIVSEAPGIYHIPGVHNMQQTLCGFVDCASVTNRDAIDFKCNCNVCISALRKIRAMRFVGGYFDGA